MTLELAIDFPFVALTTTAKRGLTVMVSQKPLARNQKRDKNVSEAVVLEYCTITPMLLSSLFPCTNE